MTLTHLCRTCRQHKAKEEFYIDKSVKSKISLRIDCKSCYADRREARRLAKKGRAIPIDENKTKLCKSCKRVKSLKCFHKNFSNADNHANTCKECKVQQYSRENKRQKYLQSQYGLSQEDYKRVVAAQKGLFCAICGSDKSLRPGYSLHVDHDHLTGMVRGLLCSHCNTLLGLARDSVGTLLKACRYLKNPPAKCLGFTQAKKQKKVGWHERKKTNSTRMQKTV